MEGNKNDIYTKTRQNYLQDSKILETYPLINYLIKALEKLCLGADKAMQKNPIHTKQHGFRTDHKTITAISEVTDYIEQNIFFNKHVLAVFLDIQAAFDTISPLKIKSTLKTHKKSIHLLLIGIKII